MTWWDRLRFRLWVWSMRIRGRALGGVTALHPGSAHIEQQQQGTGRDWKASPAVTPMPWSEDIAAHNAAIDRVALDERLEMWADLLGHPDRQAIADRAGCVRLTKDLIDGVIPIDSLTGCSQLARWASLYFAAETQQVWSRRQNVTGREKLLRRLTPEEIADARRASALASEVQSIERQRARRAAGIPDGSQAATLADALGTDEELLKACGGDPVVMAQVKARAAALLIPAVDDDEDEPVPMDDGYFR